MIAAGIGCRRGAPAPDIEAAIRAALAHARIGADALDVDRHDRSEKAPRLAFV